MSKNKSRAGIALIIVLVLVLLGIGAYVGYTYVQSDVNGNRNTKLSKTIPFGIGGWISIILSLAI